ncbi:MAG: biopolymer transporter Tol [Opitutaceae bacterium]|nr:biopolymer transporter Tol [Opitutaceae bacterium]
MKKLFSLFVFHTVATCLCALFVPANAQTAGAPGDITVNVGPGDALSVRIRGDAALVALAQKAFSTHGRYVVYAPSASGANFDLTFTGVSGTQVRVDVNKGAAAVMSQTLGGTSQANALYRAADAAVRATSGLNGFFASRLAFISNRTGADEIYVGDLFLQNVEQLTSQRARVLTPRWSPDGSRLLYTSFTNKVPDIYQIDLVQRRWQSFVSFNGTNMGARFSPDGSRVVMVLTANDRDGPHSEVFVSTAQGRQPARLTRTPLDAAKSSPCFSPDGARIVFAMKPGPQLYIMPASGGAPTRIAGGFSSYCAEPDWSRAAPDKIALTVRQGRSFQIGVWDMAGGQGRIVSKVNGDAIEPCWLADGRHVVFTFRTAGNRKLGILDTETGKHTIISSIYSEKGSVWGP